MSVPPTNSSPILQVGRLLILIWGCFLIDKVLQLDLASALGLRPRTLDGLWGIACMPFLHGSWSHLIGNTTSIAVLLCLLLAVHGHPWKVVLAITALSGCLLWIFGRSANHIGASGVIFGLVSYLIAAGYFLHRLATAVVAVVVLCLYGTTLLTGILPGQSEVSWDGHLAGAVAGGIVAFATSKALRDVERDTALVGDQPRV